MMTPGAWRRDRALEGLALGGLAVLGAMVPPDRPLPFPVCGWKALTGLDCPGCGFTRAVCHALQGDVSGSLALHVAGPVAAGALIVWAAWLLAEATANRPIGAVLRRRLFEAGLWGGGAASLLSWGARMAGGG